MMAGFGWEIGAFETWDLLGLAKTIEAMKGAGYSVASWVEKCWSPGLPLSIKWRQAEN